MIGKIVVGAGFGDEGKGAMVDYLAAKFKADLVVRFNGGAQTAHNVIHNGVHHTFRQWGSATLRGVPTLLAGGVLVDPIMALGEAEILKSIVSADPWKLLSVSPDAVIVTPWHAEVNQRHERNRAIKLGSCGMGIGVARYMELNKAPTLRFGMLHDRKRLRSRVTQILEWLMEKEEFNPVYPFERFMENLEEFFHNTRIAAPFMFDHARVVIFEGAQGILLDELYGTAPHNTWTNTTPYNAMQILPRMWRSSSEVILVTRTYATRHGFGPFPTEDPNVKWPEPHNWTGLFQGAFRQGFLDFQALRYSLHIAKLATREAQGAYPTDMKFSLALTHMDKLPYGMPYKDFTDSGVLPTDLHQLRELFYQKLGVDLNYGSYGPDSSSQLSFN